MAPLVAPGTRCGRPRVVRAVVVSAALTPARAEAALDIAERMLQLLDAVDQLEVGKRAEVLQRQRGGRILRVPVAPQSRCATPVHSSDVRRSRGTSAPILRRADRPTRTVQRDPGPCRTTSEEELEDAEVG